MTSQLKNFECQAPILILTILGNLCLLLFSKLIRKLVANIFNLLFMCLFTRKCRNLVVLTISLIASIGPTLSAKVLDGEMIANPFMEENYNHWEVKQGWRTDSNEKRLVFDIKPYNVGISKAIGRGKYFEFNPGENEPHLSAKLIDVIFNAPFIKVYNAASIGTNADYVLFFELDIVIGEGKFYRAQSQLIPEPWNLPEGDLTVNFKWLDKDDGFLGKPSSTDGGGIPVNLIKEVYYTVIMKVNQAASDSSDTVYVTIDNLSLTYQVIVE